MEDEFNITTGSDSYKLNHWNQYPLGTTSVYSYFEARRGATFPFTSFYGLQGILKSHMLGQVVTQDKIDWGAELACHHFGSEDRFNREGWEYILKEHDGRLPLHIKAVPEGTPVPINNIMMSVESTDDRCFWLTNYVESLLTHVWYPSTVSTLSRSVKIDLLEDLRESCDDPMAAIMFMLHDFGYRSATCDQAGRRGGSGHLLNFLGTDTVPAMEWAYKYYNASLEGLGYSVPATEHSVMTAEGREGEAGITGRLLDEYPEGILSLVSDSYDVYNFVNNIIGNQFREKVLARKNNAFGVRKTVTRPDSNTKRHPNPAEQMVWILKAHENNFGATLNRKGMKVLHPSIGALWGDGIDRLGIREISRAAMQAGFSAENVVYGMGGGLLQKLNRDTQRFAFKCSARQQDGRWIDVFKDPLDASKASKRGRLKLVQLGENDYDTVREEETDLPDVMEDAFLNGELCRDQSFSEIRENAEVK